MEVDTAFWSTFQTAGKSSCSIRTITQEDLLIKIIAGVYLVGEADDGDPAIVCPYQNYMSGVLNYPA